MLRKYLVLVANLFWQPLDSLGLHSEQVYVTVLVLRHLQQHVERLTMITAVLRLQNLIEVDAQRAQLHGRMVVVRKQLLQRLRVVFSAQQ